jgi:hypothetical protein
VVAKSSNEGKARFSPDGKWIAYESDESGRSQIYVIRADGSGAIQPISTGGGEFPRWRSNSGEIFYIEPIAASSQVGGVGRQSLGRLMVAPVQEQGADLRKGDVRSLFAVNAWSFQGDPYDVTPDGNRFLVNTVESVRSEAITVLVNWASRSGR